MFASLSRWLVVSDGEVVYLTGVILRACQFIPLAGLHIVADSHIDDTRFYASANGLAAIDRVGGCIEGIPSAPEIGALEVLYGIVKLDGDIAAIRAKMNQFIVVETLSCPFSHFLVFYLDAVIKGRQLDTFACHRQRVDKLPRCGMQFNDSDRLCLRRHPKTHEQG